MIRNIVKKDHYIYNDYEEVKSWSGELFHERAEDIEPEIFFRIVLEEAEKIGNFSPIEKIYY
ncbi:MAG: hypothetical protein WC942_06025 [Clostridia bacterium]|jgi:hypothetical protein